MMSLILIYNQDHTGDPSTFPSNTDLIVGPSFKSNFVPAYPTVEDSPVSESAWKGRELVEISFDSALKIGQYKAHDLHGDGSFYLLATPGHTSEHMAALARTKSDPPEFMFLGGDIAHQAGEFRPTEYMPLPDEIRPDPLQKPFVNSVSFCPGHIFSALHPRGSATKPFYTLKVKDGIHVDGAQAQATVDDMQAFDAHENIFVAIAHDHSLKDVYDYFPKSANGWKEKGWKKEGRWRFLAEFGTGSKE